MYANKHIVLSFIWTLMMVPAAVVIASSQAVVEELSAGKFQLSFLLPMLCVELRLVCLFGPRAAC